MEESKHPNFDQLWHIKEAMFRNIHVKNMEEKEPTWYQYNITATTATDLPKHGEVVYPKGTKVRIWMVSRFGDAGITGDLTDKANGYDVRGVDVDTDLENLEIILNQP